MGKAHSGDLRERVYGEIADGRSRRASARRFGVSASTGVRLARRMAETGSLAPARQGRPPGGGKLAPYRALLIGWVEGDGEITMPELATRLMRERQVVVHRQKTLLASEAGRDDVARARRTWRLGRQPRMREEPHRLVFVDETATTTKMVRLRDRARRGQRLKARAPLGHWGTQTFIAALRCDGLTAPWLIGRPMNRKIFETWVETQLARRFRVEMSLSSTTCPATKAPRPPPSSTSAAPGSCSSRPIRAISNQSKWPSPSSRPTFDASAPGPSTHSGAPLATSATSTHPKSAGTTSKQQASARLNARCSRAARSIVGVLRQAQTGIR